MPEAPDQNIRAVLQKAAADPAFLARLLNDRDAALKEFPLSDAERNLLMSASPDQIEKMVGHARPKPGTSFSPLRVAVGVGAAGVLFALATPATLGVRPDRIAHINLERIADAQRVYKEQFGRYGNMQELTGGKDYLLPPGLAEKRGSVVYEIIVDGNSFTATARLWGNDRAWQVGPDGKVKPLE